MTRLLSQSFFRIQQVKLLRNIQRVKLKIADKRRWKFYVLNETDFKMAVFGVIHEAFNERASINGCVVFICPGVYEGTSMGIHESQSLFNEIIIGSSRSFWKKQYPFFQGVSVIKNIAYLLCR
ncbi:hypothetical protein EfmAA94_13050 [Enterococcus faecium]|nr:hypothetical protein EfmAA94_13050 [Enterococcus faecium]